MALGHSDDYFVSAAPNPSDLGYILVITLFLVAFIFGIVALQSDIAAAWDFVIYAVLGLFAYTILLVSNLSRGRLPGGVLFGSLKTSRQLYITLAIGAAFGIIVTLPEWFAPLSFLSWLSLPVDLSVATAGLTASSAIVLLLLLAFYEPEIEEALVRSVFVPLFTHIPLAILLLFAAVSSLFVPALLPITLLLFFLSFAVGLFKARKRDPSAQPRRSLRRTFYGALITSFVTTSLLFSILHVSASPADAGTIMLKAFLFAISITLIDWVLQNTMAGRISHSINNSVYAVMTLGLPLQEVVLMPVMYAFLIVLAFNRGHVLARVFGSHPARGAFAVAPLLALPLLQLSNVTSGLTAGLGSIGSQLALSALQAWLALHITDFGFVFLGILVLVPGKKLLKGGADVVAILLGIVLIAMGIAQFLGVNFFALTGL